MISNNCTRNDIPAPIALEFCKVAICRGKRQITGEMSMKFQAGTVSGFYGENGCGKSSVLKAAAGLVREGVKGQVVWFERQLELTDRLRRRVGFQLQSAPVFTNLTVKEQLRLAAQNRLGDARKIGSALERVFEDFAVLGQRETALASKLNGGTRRILSIGLACVALEDGILVLDEPTNDLSRESAWDLGRAIRRLAERDRNAVIVVSHDFQWLRATSDHKRVYTLRNKPKEVPSKAIANYPPSNSTAPVSPLPESTVPEPTVPEPKVPEPTLPETTLPETTAPEPTVPETTVPETTVLESTVPESTVPQTAVPESTVPESAVPKPLISLPLHIDRGTIDLRSFATDAYPTNSANDLALSFLMTASECYDLIAQQTNPVRPITDNELCPPIYAVLPNSISRTSETQPRQ